MTVSAAGASYSRRMPLMSRKEALPGEPSPNVYEPNSEKSPVRSGSYKSCIRGETCATFVIHGRTMGGMEGKRT